MAKVWSGKLKCTFHGPRHWELDKDLWFLSTQVYQYFSEWRELGVELTRTIKREGPPSTKAKVIIRAGYHTDLASIHRLAWSFIAPWDVARAAIIHDLLYKKIRLYRAGGGDDNQLIKKAKDASDNVFLMAMKDANPSVSSWKIRSAYWSVRLFGKWSIIPREED